MLINYTLKVGLGNFVFKTYFKNFSLILPQRNYLEIIKFLSSQGSQLPRDAMNSLLNSWLPPSVWWYLASFAAIIHLSMLFLSVCSITCPFLLTSIFDVFPPIALHRDYSTNTIIDHYLEEKMNEY